MNYDSKIKPRLWCHIPVEKVTLNEYGVTISYKGYSSQNSTTLSWHILKTHALVKTLFHGRPPFARLWIKEAKNLGIKT